MEIITFSSLKGGVGKTTVLYAYANELAKRNKKVLIIDLDSQCNTSKLFSNEYNTDKNAYNLFKNKDVNNNIVKIKHNISLVPGDIRISVLNNELIHALQRELLLFKIIKSLNEDFDYLLIDTHPDFSIITTNALIISSMIISPINPNSFSFQSIELLSKHWEQVISEIGIENKLYLLPNNVKKNTKSSKELIEDIYKIEEKTLKTIIPSMEIFNKITLNNDVLENYPKAEKAIESIESLANEIDSIVNEVFD